MLVLIHTWSKNIQTLNGNLTSIKYKFWSQSDVHVQFLLLFWAHLSWCIRLHCNLRSWCLGFLVGSFPTFSALNGHFLCLGGEAWFFFYGKFTTALLGHLILGWGACFFFSFGSNKAPTHPQTYAVDTATFSVFLAANMKDKEAPLSLVFTNLLKVIENIIYILINGDNVSQSTL